MKNRIIAIALIIILLFSISACTVQETPGGNVNFGDYEIETELYLTEQYDPADRLNIDFSWCESYIVSYSKYDKGVGESILYEGRCGNYLQILDKHSGIITYYVQEDAYMLMYILSSNQQQGVVSVISDESVDTIAQFPALTVCKENFPSRVNVTKVGSNFVGNRSATRYKQEERIDGVLKRIAYVWIDDEYGFASKCEVYDATTQELIKRWELLDFTTNVSEDAIKINLDSFDIVSQE